MGTSACAHSVQWSIWRGVPVDNSHLHDLHTRNTGLGTLGSEGVSVSAPGSRISVRQKVDQTSCRGSRGCGTYGLLMIDSLPVKKKVS